MAQVQYFRPFLNDNDYENYMVIIALGMSHAFGFGQGIVVNLDYGGTDILCGKPGRDTSGDRKVSADRLAERSAVDEAYSYPRGISENDISSLKVITCGSAPLPVDVIRRAEELTGAVITEGYGMTETVNTITINGHDHSQGRYLGVVNPNIECTSS